MVERPIGARLCSAGAQGCRLSCFLAAWPTGDCICVLQDGWARAQITALLLAVCVTLRSRRPAHTVAPTRLVFTCLQEARTGLGLCNIGSSSSH